jgi:hypothetical protein
MTHIPNASAAVGTTWTKSSHSAPNNDCVEVAHSVTNLMPVRDSKRPTGPAIVFPAGAWTAFVADLKADA